MCANPKKFPVQLSETYVKDKRSIFNDWLVCNKDLKEVALIFSRKMEHTNQSKKKWVQMKKAGLLQIYSAQKTADIMQKRLTDGLAYYYMEMSSMFVYLPARLVSRCLSRKPTPLRSLNHATNTNV